MRVMTAQQGPVHPSSMVCGGHRLRLITLASERVIWRKAVLLGTVLCFLLEILVELCKIGRTASERAPYSLLSNRDQEHTTRGPRLLPLAGC